ncbi:MAG: hypothetical protein E7680_06235 [Ruminococcaceae bacterium]|nr:hypothetical protein [Oscillospiraceae bacterium]
MRPDRTIVLLFCVILALLAILFFVLPQNPFSQSEKRALQQTPKFSFSKLLSGKLTAEIDAWFADQFPLREGFVGVKSIVTILSGQRQNNGILLGADGQLARWDFDGGSDTQIDRIDEARLLSSCAGITRVDENVNLPTVFLFPSRNLDVAESSFDYPDVTGKAIRQILTESLSGIRFADVEPVLQEKYKSGEAVVFRTDHHWTALGAYYAYCEVMKQFNLEHEILPREYFREEIVTGGFGGTYRSRGEMQWIQKEPIAVWYGADETEYTVTADGKPLDGFYTVLPKEEIGYELFLDGTHDMVRIEKEGKNRPKLLIFKDSFANSLAPFLARHFDLILFNLSSPKKDFTNISETVTQFDPDAVLIVYSVYNLLTTETAEHFR